jgi:preprotein translocase subunit SecY
MKSIIFLGVYLLSFVIIYMMMSLVPLVFSNTSYVDILRNNNWTMMYSLFFGWWMSIFPAREYYLINQSYLDRVF